MKKWNVSDEILARISCYGVRKYTRTVTVTPAGYFLNSIVAESRDASALASPRPATGMGELGSSVQ